MAGCVGCFHTASPFFAAVDRGEGVSVAGVQARHERAPPERTAARLDRSRCTHGSQDLVMPAVLGTTNVLESCLKAGTIRRVVLTSSFAAIFNPGSPDFPPDATYTDAVRHCGLVIRLRASCGVGRLGSGGGFRVGGWWLLLLPALQHHQVHSTSLTANVSGTHSDN